MRLLTALRRLDDQKKNVLVLVTTIILTVCIIVLGIVSTKSFLFYSQTEKAESRSTSTLSSFFNDAKASMLPTFSNIKQGFSSVSEQYKNSGFKDFFVPKNN